MTNIINDQHLDHRENLNSPQSFLDSWAEGLLADPITKMPCSSQSFKKRKGIIDARVQLKNSYGYTEWFVGQEEFEKFASEGEGFKDQVEGFKREINYDRPVYERSNMLGSILDIGGGMGTVREFLPQDVKFISVDPYIDAPFQMPPARKKAYSCLSNRLNFVAGVAEFLPFKSESFNWVHMRSMLDHVQIPDLALIEAHRVLKLDGQILIGLLVDGGKSGKKTLMRFIKDIVKHSLGAVGIEKWKDHHTWHPTYKKLIKLITDNGFLIEDTFWQPQWNDTVVYVSARKS